MNYPFFTFLKRALVLGWLLNGLISAGWACHFDSLNAAPCEGDVQPGTPITLTHTASPQPQDTNPNVCLVYAWDMPASVTLCSSYVSSRDTNCSQWTKYCPQANAQLVGNAQSSLAPNGNASINVAGNSSFLPGGHTLDVFGYPLQCDGPSCTAHISNHYILSDAVPGIVQHASAASLPNTLSSMNLSVMGSYLYGESSLTYTWTVMSNSVGTVQFSINGTNASKTTTATFSTPGIYYLEVALQTPYDHLMAFDTVPVIIKAPTPPTLSKAASASPNPTTGTTTALSVLGTDDLGEGNLTYTWALTGTPPANVTFSANDTNAAKNTTATFTKPGSYKLQVTLKDSQGLTTASAVTVTVQATPTSLTISPSLAQVSLNGSQLFTLIAKDQFGNSIAVPTPTAWSVSGGGTMANGTFTAGTTPGSYLIKASANNLDATASVTVVNTAPTVATPAAASQNPVTGTMVNLSVLGADDGGESNLTYTWAPTGTPPANVTFSANGTNAAKNTTATFTKSGSYNFQVTIKDVEGETATSAVTVIVQGTATTLTVSPSLAQVSLNGSQLFTLNAKDQFGNTTAVPSPTTWAVSGGGTILNGTFTAGTTPGTYQITASAGGLQAQTNVLVSHSLTIAAPAVASPNPVTGTTTNLFVLAADDSGESTLTYTWAAIGTPPASVAFSANGTHAANNTTATFAHAGSYILQVTAKDLYGFIVTANVTVVVNPVLTAINVFPHTTSVGVTGQQLFTASLLDQFNQPMDPAPVVIWSSDGGTVDSGGLFTAGATPGSFTVTAHADSLSGGALITITNTTGPVPPPTGINPNPNPNPPPFSVPTPSLILPSVISLHQNFQIDPQPYASLSTPVSFTWVVNAQSGQTRPTLAVPRAPGTGQYTLQTQAYSISPLTLGLSVGTYQINVTATTNGVTSAPAEATVTIVGDDLSSVSVFPNPWRSDKHSGHPITFTHLPLNSTVKIFGIAGHWIKTLQSSTGSIPWDLTNDSGDPVASGIYLYLITDDQGQMTRGKLVIIR